MPPRLTVPDPRIDAVRGCVAIERGPLVYCIETADLPAGRRARGRRPSTPRRSGWRHLGRDDLAAGLVGLSVEAIHRPAASLAGRIGPSRAVAEARRHVDRGRRDPLLRLGQPRRRGDAGLAAGDGDPPYAVTGAAAPTVRARIALSRFMTSFSPRPK